MARATTCKVCLADNQDALEAIGLSAMGEEISWREAARQAGFSHHAGLKNHMVEHYVDQRVREAESAVADEAERLIADTVAELRAGLATAPPEVKPLYLAAIHNVQGLAQTKPSQQHLIMALRTIQEMTGMKQEQRLMLQFAEAAFGAKEVEARKALPQDTIIDIAEVLTDE